MEKRAQLDLENLVWVTRQDCQEECGRSTGRARGDSDGTTGESCSVVLSCTCVRAHSPASSDSAQNPPVYLPSKLETKTHSHFSM